MRIKSKSGRHFHGTHKGYDIEIEKEGDGRFYIRVFNGHGHAYDGWAPEAITTMKAAKAEALRGACL